VDPYAPPRAPSLAVGPTDDVDLFLETLPPPLLKAAFGALVIMGLVVLLLAVRLMIALVATPMAIALEAGHVVLGLLCFAVGWGIKSGHMPLLFVGFVVCPLVGVASIVALLTGSVGGLFGGALALTTVVLLAFNFQAVARIGRARRAIAARGV
jgi:hypothetical protein